MAQVKTPPATFEQVEASAKATELYGKVYVGDIRHTERSQVRDISLTIDVWPEGYEAGLRGRIVWTLWGDQCDTKGEQIREIYHEHSGLVIVRGIHKGKSYIDKNSGMEIEKIEATSFDFSNFGAGLISPDVAVLREQISELQETVNNQQAWIAWLSQYQTAIEKAAASAANAEAI